MRTRVDERIAERADHQLGLFTNHQMLAAGGDRRLRARRVAQGRWDQRSPRVLSLTAHPRSWPQLVLAGVLDAGDGALANGLTAAAVLEVPTFGRRAEQPHVLTMRGGNHRPILCRLSETFWLPPEHRTEHGDIPVVSLARLPFELAMARLPKRRIMWLIDFAINERGLGHEDLARAGAVLCRRGRPASPLMRQLVDHFAPGYVPPASVLEADFRDLCDRFGLDQGVRQVNAGGSAWIGRVDVAYPRQKLLVELDSRRWHNTSSAFESDRQRSNALVLAGWRVVRITWRMIHDDPAGVARLLASLLSSAA